MSRFSFGSSNDEHQVDPFNAGEPTLPWDDPAAMVDDRRPSASPDSSSPATPFDEPNKEDDDYRAPARQRDSYEAPSVDTEVSESQAPSEKTHAKRQKDAKARRRRTQPATRRQAGDSGKKHGSHNIGCIIALAFFALAMVGNVGSCSVGIVSALFGRSDSAGTNSSYSTDNSQDEAAELKAATKSLKSTLDGLSQNPDAIKLAQDSISDQLDSYLGYTPEELGIDTSAYADWFFSKLSLDIRPDSSYLGSDGEAYLSVDIIMPEGYKIASDMADLSRDYRGANRLNGSTESGSTPLTPEQQEQMRSYFDQALANAQLREDGYFNFTMVKRGEDWEIDSKDYQDAMSYLFGIY